MLRLMHRTQCLKLRRAKALPLVQGAASPDGGAPAPRGRAGRWAPGGLGLALSLAWAGPSEGGCLDHGRGQRAPASAGKVPGHVIRAPAWHGSMPCPDFRGACPALPWTAGPAHSPHRRCHGAEASTMRDAPAPCPARPASLRGGAMDGTSAGRASGMPSPAPAGLSAGLSGPCPCADTRPRSNAGGGRLEASCRRVRREPWELARCVPLLALRTAGPSAMRHYAAAQPRRGTGAG